VVALGASVTETVEALGAGAWLVGVDRSSASLPAARRVPVLGYFRALNAEGVLSLRPTLVLTTTDAGPPAALQQLRAAGVAVRLLPAAESVEGAADKLRGVGAALGLAGRADSLAAAMRAEVRAAAAAARAAAARAGGAPRALFIYARGPGHLYVAGTATGADAMLRLAGARNAVTAFSGFRPLTAEAVVTAAPDVLVLPARGLESVGGLAGLRRLPGVALTPAARRGRVAAVDDALLLGFGPRLGEAVRQLAVAIHAPAGAAAAVAPARGAARP